MNGCGIHNSPAQSYENICLIFLPQYLPSYVCVLQLSDGLVPSGDGSVILSLDVREHLPILAELIDGVLKHLTVYLKSAG